MLILWCVLLVAEAQGEMQVSTDFEGGSARVLAIDEAAGTLRIMPGGDPDRGWACWWSLRIDQVQPGRTLTLQLEASDRPTRNNGQLTSKPLGASWAMPTRAFMSQDGRTWQPTPPGTREGNCIRYLLQAEGTSLWVAWGPPFTPRDTAELIEKSLEEIPGAQRFELARSREGRPVLGLRIGQEQGVSSSRPAVWVQARQHAWESGASWVARGLVEWLAGQEPAARWLTEHAELVIVPIMDVDNVVTGNGGKEQDPRDHNRDWDDAPVFPEVAAAQRSMLAFAKEGRLDLFVDLHNPAPGDARPFFFCGPPELLHDVGRNNRALFLSIAAKQIAGPLPVEPSPRITGPGYHPLWRNISGQWVNAHGNDHTVAVCLETAWNTPKSTVEAYQAVGRQLGETISEFLQRRAR